VEVPSVDMDAAAERAAGRVQPVTPWLRAEGISR
jgi:hypothetical protein